MMKPLAALAAALAFSSTAAFAQQPAAPAAPAAAPKAPAEMSSSELRTLIQSDRKGLVAKGMALDEKDAAKFWPLYEAFQKELAEPRRKRNRAILDFISAGADLTDANAKRLADQVLDAG